MGYTPYSGSTARAQFVGTLNHTNGLQVRIEVYEEVNGFGPVDTTDGKAAFSAAIDAVMTDTDFTLASAAAVYSPDGENYTP